MERKNYQEKRLYPRRPIRTQVVMENGDSEGVLYFFTTDISAGGLFLESEKAIEMGTQVFLRFSLLPHSKPIQATGEVVRVMRDETQPGSKVGIGIRFVYVHPLDRELIQEFISQMN